MILNNDKETEFYTEVSKPEEWRKMFLSLCFFHSVVRERRKYGSLGWNLPYDFNDSDFQISMRQLNMMIENFTYIPFKALIYLTGECNYGGRVTDDWDRRVLMTLLDDFYNKDVLDSDYSFSPIKEFYIQQEGELEDYLDFVTKLPEEVSPELFGLNENADINYAISETNTIIYDILSLSSNQSSGSSSSSN